MWLNYWLLKRIGAARLLTMGLVQPVAAVILGAIFLGESLGAGAIAGGVLVLVSLAMVLDVRGQRRSG